MATNECNCNNEVVGTEATPVYYKDDLDFYLKLLDGEGNGIGLPDYDWSARVWTSSKFNYITVSSVGGVKTNWRDEGDGRIHVVVDNPGLMPGDVHIDFEALLPNEAFADGSRRIIKTFAAPMRLTRDNAPCPSAIELELMLPYIRGKALTFDDLTEEEIKELQRPATEAAARLDEFVKTAEAEENERQAAETLRDGEEQKRAAAETSRANAETVRTANETARAEAETARDTAEKERARVFATYEATINDLQTRLAALESKRSIILEE